MHTHIDKYIHCGPTALHIHRHIYVYGSKWIREFMQVCMSGRARCLKNTHMKSSSHPRQPNCQVWRKGPLLGTRTKNNPPDILTCWHTYEWTLFGDVAHVGGHGCPATEWALLLSRSAEYGGIHMVHIYSFFALYNPKVPGYCQHRPFVVHRLSTDRTSD